MIKAELARSSKKRMNKIFIRTDVIKVVLYHIIAIGGYYGLCENTPDLIIRRPNLHKSIDYYIIIVRALYPLYLTIGIPVNASPLRR